MMQLETSTNSDERLERIEALLAEILTEMKSGRSWREAVHGSADLGSNNFAGRSTTWIREWHRSLWHGARGC